MERETATVRTCRGEVHGAQPIPGPHVPRGPARSPALSVHESAEPGSQRRKEKDHVYHEHSTPVTLPTQDPQRTPGSQRERHRPGFGIKVPETRNDAPPGVRSRATELARDPGTRRQCPPLPWVLRTGAGGSLSQLARVTCGQTARPKGHSFDAKKPHGTNRLGPPCLWRSPYRRRAGDLGQSMCPPMQGSYVLLRHVDNRPWGSRGSREAWLPHSVLPWVALEESFPWG